MSHTGVHVPFVLVDHWIAWARYGLAMGHAPLDASLEGRVAWGRGGNRSYIVARGTL